MGNQLPNDPALGDPVSVITVATPFAAILKSWVYAFRGISRVPFTDAAHFISRQP
jgi:hypothetical protein